jgi:hypothetical protein
MLKGIFISYKSDIICRILKLNGYIARSTAIQTVERILWEKFDLKDLIESIPDYDHFIDPTKPLIPRLYFKHVKPIRISLALSEPILNKKRPAAEE